MTEAQAYVEMLEGYFDGLRGEPEPGRNRSHSFRHGWKNGRDDRTKSPRASSSYIHDEAKQAVAADVAA